MSLNRENNLPKNATKRLGELGDQFFTSDLTVNEFLLVKEAQCHPLGLVMGSSIYHTGLQLRSWSSSRELTILTEAMYNARELAMARLEAEALALGADGVVGVRLEANYHNWGHNAIEFIAVGTAIRSDAPGSLRRPDGQPFTSDLSGQEFWLVLQSGYVPRGLVLGNCVFHIGRRGPFATARSTYRNVELPHVSQAIYQARELAMTRMQDDALRLDASGIIGVDLSEKSHHFGQRVIEFLVIGTAVSKIDGTEQIPAPLTTISLER